MWEGPHNNYVTFGRIASKAHADSIATDSTWTLASALSPMGDEPERHEGDLNVFIVYAIPVPSDGHSLTNLMYGKDGKSYLYHKGKVYVRSRKKKV